MPPPVSLVLPGMSGFCGSELYAVMTLEPLSAVEPPLEEQHTECACGRSESQSFLLHGIHILLIHYFQSRKALFKKKAGVNTVASTSVFVLMVGSLSLD